MRRLGTATLLVAALLLPGGTAGAAADDPWVAYVVNSVVTRGGQPSAVVVRSNPATGALQEVSRNGAQGALFQHPYDIAAAPGGRSLYVVDMGEFASGTNPAADGRIIRVDPATGVQSLVSQGGELVDPAGIAVAPDGTLFVVENVGVGPARDPAVVRIDPASGAQSVLTRGNNLCYPFGIALEPSGNLIVTDFGDLTAGGAIQIDCLQDFGSVVRVSPSGAQQLLSFNEMPAPGNVLRGTFGAAVDPSGAVLVVNQTSAQAAVAAIDSANGSQTAVTPNSTTADAFELPQRVTVLPDGNLLVADYALNDQEGGLVGVDRATGAASIVRQGTLFNNPIGVTAVVNRPPSAVLTIRPRTGRRGRGGDLQRIRLGGPRRAAAPLRLGSRRQRTLRAGDGQQLHDEEELRREHHADAAREGSRPARRGGDRRRERVARRRRDPARDRALPRLVTHDRDSRGREGRGRAQGQLPVPAVGGGARPHRDRARPRGPARGRAVRCARQGPSRRQALYALARARGAA